MCQYPLVFAYFVTTHKSQGLTMPDVIIHSKNKFMPDLIYVAASRVTSAGHLQLLNFKTKQLLKLTAEVV